MGRGILSFLLGIISFVLYAQSGLTEHGDGYSLPALIDHLEDTHDFRFAYSTAILTNDYKQQIKLSNQITFSELEHVFDMYGLEVNMTSDNHVLLRQRPKSTSHEENFLVEGYILDSDNQALEYAAVFIQNTTHGAFTDSLGRFSMEIPVKYREATATISLLGYDDYSIPTKDLDGGSVQLVTREFAIEEILMIGQLPKVLTRNSANIIQSFGESPSESVAFQMDDPIRRVMLSAGVDASSEGHSELVIRGSDGDETITLLDGMPIFHTGHYNGTYSSFNGDYVDDIKLYKNDLPPQHSGKLAGVVELNSGKPSDNMMLLNANNLVPALTVKQNFKNNGFLNFSARTSLGDVGNESIFSIGRQNESARNVISIDPTVNFSDAHLNYGQAIGQQFDLKISGFFSNDNQSSSFYHPLSENQFRREVEYEQDLKWQNYAGQVGLDYKLSSNKKFSIQVYDSYASQDVDNEIEVELRREAPNEEIEEDDEEREFSESKEYGSNNYLNEMGATVQYDVISDRWIQNYGIKAIVQETEFVVNLDEKIVENDKIQGTTASLFTQQTFDFKNGIRTNLGGSLQYFDTTNKFYFSPQFRLEYTPVHYMTLKGSVGLNWQFINKVSFDDFQGNTLSQWLLASSDDDISSSLNTMLGVSFSKSNVRLDIEVYRKDRDNEILFSPIQSMKISEFDIFDLIDDYKFIYGEGYSQGLDVGIGYKNRFWDSYLGYTLSKSVYRFDDINGGNYMPTNHDKRHQFSFTNRLKYNDFHVGMDYVFSTGAPFINFENQNNQNENNIRPSALLRMPSYHRMDLSLSREFTLNKYRFTAGFSVLNVFNHENIDAIQQLTTINNGKERRTSIITTKSLLLRRTLEFGVKLKL